MYIQFTASLSSSLSSLLAGLLLLLLLLLALVLALVLVVVVLLALALARSSPSQKPRIAAASLHVAALLRPPPCVLPSAPDCAALLLAAAGASQPHAPHRAVRLPALAHPPRARRHRVGSGSTGDG